MFEKIAAEFTARYNNHSSLLSDQQSREMDSIHTLTDTINSKEFGEQFRNFVHSTLEHIREYVAAIINAMESADTTKDNPIFVLPMTVVYRSRDRRLSLTDGKWVWETPKEMRATLLIMPTGIAVAEWKGMVPNKYPNPLPPKSFIDPQVFRIKPNGTEVDMFQHIEEYLVDQFDEPETVDMAERRVETIDLADHLLTTIGNAFYSFGNAILPLLFKRRNDSLRELANTKQFVQLGIDFVRKDGVVDQSDPREHMLQDTLIGDQTSGQQT